MNLFLLLLFMLLPLSGLAYAGWHVWVLLPVGAVWKSIVLALGAASFLLLFYVVSGRLDALPLPLARALYNIGTSSIVVLLYLVLIFLVLDMGRLCRVVPRTVLYANGWTALAVAAVLTALFVYGRVHYRHKVRVPLTVVSEKRLPRPCRVVMVSDLHLGYHNGRRELARWVDLLNAERPDVILIAGDIIDMSLRPLREEDMAAEFRRLRAPVYACLGNHEYYAGMRGGDKASRPYTPADFYRDAGIHLLMDEAVCLNPPAEAPMNPPAEAPMNPSGSGGSPSLLIIGRDDRTNPHRKSLDELMADAKGLLGGPKGQGGKALPAIGGDEGPFTILLDHQPHDLEEAERAGIDLQLSGHTHRGQVWPASWVTDWIFECSWGSHRRGRTQYYVSSGIGIWGGRYRIGTQSEYVVLTITDNP